MPVVVNYPPPSSVVVNEVTGAVTVVAAGPRGVQGVPGDAATVAVGTVATGAPGSDATVTNSGTSGAAVLDFAIPRGDVGQQGIQGVPGNAATVTAGTTTTGAPGSSASVTNSGSSSAAVFDFAIPEGVQGQQGIQGIPGDAATIAAGTTTTGAAGSSASVTNSGSSSAAVFDFTIPQGIQGVQGVKGDTGVVAAVAPITYDEPTQTVGIDPSGFVVSVNALAGTVTLDAAAVGAYPATNPSGFVDAAGAAVAAPVQSVNSLSGTVTLDAAAVGALGTAATTDVITEGTTNLYNRVPTGGGAGQVLVKSSATNFDTSWGEPSFFLAKPRVNLSLPQPGGALTTNTWTLDRLYLGFLPCPYPVTVDQIGIAVTTAGSASSVCRLGLYDVDADGAPGNVLVDAGTVATDTTGDKIITLGTAVTLSRRGFYTAFVPQVTITSLAVRVRGFAANTYVPTSATNFLSSTPISVFTQNNVTGALPSTGPTTANFSIMPVVFLRVASIL
jgi:hypothetical protein